MSGGHRLTLPHFILRGERAAAHDHWGAISGPPMRLIAAGAVDDFSQRLTGQKPS